MVFFGYLKFASIFRFLNIQIILVIFFCRLNVFKRVYYHAFFSRNYKFSYQQISFYHILLKLKRKHNLQRLLSCFFFPTKKATNKFWVKSEFSFCFVVFIQIIMPFKSSLHAYYISSFAVPFADIEDKLICKENNLSPW